MICPQCRKGDHGDCPELRRQALPGLTGTERQGGQHCECRHARGTVLRSDRKPDPRRGG